MTARLALLTSALALAVLGDVAAAEGATLQDAVRLTIYVSDVTRLRPVVNKVQEDMWGKGPYPPRTVLEVRKLDQDDIAEVDATCYPPGEVVAPVLRRLVAS